LAVPAAKPQQQPVPTSKGAAAEVQGKDASNKPITPSAFLKAFRGR